MSGAILAAIVCGFGVAGFIALRVIRQVRADWREQGELEQAMEAERVRKQSEREALAARETVRADALRRPERVPDDDGFRRD